MARYGPARAGPVGVSDMTRRRFSNQGKRCCFALIVSITGSQRFLTRKWVQVHDQGFRCLVQLPRSVEELPPQGPHVLACIVRSQLLAQVGYRVVHQRHQPADHLQRPAVKARPLPVRDSPCRSRTAPHPPTGHAPRPDGPARVLAGARKIVSTSSGSPAQVVYSGCQRSFLGPGRTSRQTTVRTACSGVLVLEHRRASRPGGLPSAGRRRTRRVPRPTRTSRWAVASRPASGAGSGRRAA